MNCVIFRLYLLSLFGCQINRLCRLCILYECPGLDACVDRVGTRCRIINQLIVFCKDASDFISVHYIRNSTCIQNSKICITTLSYIVQYNFMQAIIINCINWPLLKSGSVDFKGSLIRIRVTIE